MCNDKPSPLRPSLCLMTVCENCCRLSTTGDSDDLRTEIVCEFRNSNKLCVMEEVSESGGELLELTFELTIDLFEQSPSSKPQALLLHKGSQRELFRMLNVHKLTSQQSPRSYWHPEFAQPMSQIPFPLTFGGQILISHKQSPPSNWHSEMLQMGSHCS